MNYQDTKRHPTPIPLPSKTMLFGGGAVATLACFFACSSPRDSGEAVTKLEQPIVVTPAANEFAKNRIGAATFNGRTYVGWVDNDGDHHIQVASTPACPYDTWPQSEYQKTTFDAEHGSDDVKGGVSMAATADRLFLVYTGQNPNNVWLKWMFIDQTDGGNVETWSDPIQLAGSGAEDDAPSIAISKDSLYVAFNDRGVFVNGFSVNFMHVAHATIPTSPPQATDTITFDYSVTLPNDGQVHRSDEGPSLTFYNTNFGDDSQSKTDHLLLAYNTQTQCTESLQQRCRHLVIDFLDTTNASTLSQPFAIEFSREYEDTVKAKNDFQKAPAIAGLADGVAVAWRQDRGGGDDRLIHTIHFSDDEMAGFYQLAASKPPGVVYGDEGDEKGVDLDKVAVSDTGQFTERSPNLALLLACNGSTIVSGTGAALVWPGTDQAVNVQSNIVGAGSCPFKYNFADTTDHNPAYANNLFEARRETVVREYACCIPPGQAGGSSIVARLAFSSVFPKAGDTCPNPTPECPTFHHTGATCTDEAQTWIKQQTGQKKELGSGVGFGVITDCSGDSWDVSSNEFMREYFHGANLDSATKDVLKNLVNGNANGCHLRETPVGILRPGDENTNGSAKETENHLLLIESNRFLYNQALGSVSDNTTADNQGHSVQAWLQTRLQDIFKGYFYEFNSPTYESYHAAAVIDLFENATDPAIRTGARMVLDLLSAHEAVATKDLRRMVPFRRHPVNWDRNGFFTRHEERGRFEVLTGESRMLADVCPERSRSEADTAIGTYKIPDLILDRLLNRAHQRGFARLHLGNRNSTAYNNSMDPSNGNWGKADGWETFYQDPDFFISSGGIASLNQYGKDCAFSGLECAEENENGRDVFTTLMPTGIAAISGLTIHIEQPTELNTNWEYDLDDSTVSPWRKSCVGPNFACGRDVVIPAALCQEQAGPFTFVDFTASCARLHPTDGHGFYAAVFQPNSRDFGFFEVEGVKTVGGTIGNLQQFETAVLTRNQGGSWSSGASMNVYTTLQGDTITFAPLFFLDAWNLIDVTRNCSAAVNPAACNAQTVPEIRAFADPNSVLAKGDFLTNTDPVTGSENGSRLWISNPYSCQRMVMDFADKGNPFYVDPNNGANRLCDPVAGLCQTPCVATATGTCSCPSTSVCNPPTDVTASLPAGACQGYFAQFVIDPTTCPSQVALWTPLPNFGSPNSSFTEGNGANAVVVLNGKPNGTPSVGFQIDFPQAATTVPPGCQVQTGGSVSGLVSCNPVHATLDLPPGRYGDVLVDNPSGDLILHPGDYMFDSLTLNPHTTLQLPADQRVRIITVKSAAMHAGVVCADASGTVACNPDSVASNFGIMDLGTTQVMIDGTFPGTVVAPNATIHVRTKAGTVYGSFWSKVGVVVAPPGAVVVPSTNVFFAPKDGPAFPACGGGMTDAGVSD